MSTFQEVNDARLIELLGKARSRVVFIAPGVHEPVAKALGQRFAEDRDLSITVILDPDEDVCRIGYGDAEGLKLLGKYAREQGFVLLEQRGLRIGVLLVDDVTLVWSPTPRSVEVVPTGKATVPSAGAPNGLLLGEKPAEQLAYAVSAAGTQTLPSDAEIGLQAVTPQRVQQTLTELQKNPPIPVDLARITRVFSTKLQFVELTIRGAKFSKRELRIANEYLNSDIRGELKGLVNSRLRAFGDFRDELVEVPAFTDGKESFDEAGKRASEKVSEASLQRQRNELERRYIYNIPGFGRLIAKDDTQDFEKLVAAFRVQLDAYSKAIRKKLDEQTSRIVDDAMELVAERAARSNLQLNLDEVRSAIENGLDRAKDEAPEVKVVFKGITHEQTSNPGFRAKVDKALPPSKRKQLGDWSENFDAAQAADRRGQAT